MKRGGELIKHICEKKIYISNQTTETVNFRFSHYKSMGTKSCHSNKSSYPTGIKKIQFMKRLMSLVCMPNYSFIHLMVSEKKIV